MMKPVPAEISLLSTEKKLPTALMLLTGVLSMIFAILFLALGYVFSIAGILLARAKCHTHKTGLVLAFSIIGLLLSLLNTVLTLLVTM